MISSLEYRSHEHSCRAEPIRPNAALFKFVMPGLNNGLGDAGVWYGYIGNSMYKVRVSWGNINAL